MKAINIGCQIKMTKVWCLLTHNEIYCISSITKKNIYGVITVYPHSCQEDFFTLPNLQI